MGPTQLLQELLRVDTTNPPGNENLAVELLESYLEVGGIKTEIFSGPTGRPCLIGRIDGPRAAPALVLLSHTDVVGVEEKKWTRDPFGGEIAGGAVWGRGALDMKGIAVMHAAAAVRALAGGATPGRELIVAAVPDEEAGGAEGAGWLLDEHPEAVGFDPDRPAPEVLGEGGFGIAGVVDRPVMPIVLGEKTSLKLHLTASGRPGHGSLPPRDQALLHLGRVVRRLSGFGPPRVHPVMRAQFATLANATAGPRSLAFRALASGAGDLAAKALKKPLQRSGTIATLLADTVAPTIVHGGYKENVIPGEARAVLDCRLLPDTDVDRFIADAGAVAAQHHCAVEPTSQGGAPASTPGPLHDILVEASMRLVERPIVVPSLTPGFTDVRYFRRRGATGYGWVPLVLEQELLQTIHGDDERIPVDGFERAVAAMSEVVAAALRSSEEGSPRRTAQG